MDSASSEPEVNVPEAPKYSPEKDLFKWVAPSRPFKRRSREYFVTLFAIVSLVGFILFIAEGAMPVILLISVVFLFYVLNNTQPTQIEYKITDRGIKIDGRRNEWGGMISFSFSKYGEYDLLRIETYQIPGRLEVVINNSDLEEIRKHMSVYLPEEEPQINSAEKFTSWISNKLPGN